MLFNILARLKRKKKATVYQDVICLNCETKFSGNFCPNCGQAVKDYDKPFSFIFFNFMGDFFAFDTRFFRTAVALVIKPGYLSKQYFAGRLVKYAPPFRLFLFMSFIFFLLLQIYTSRGLTTVLDKDLNKEKAALDSFALNNADLLLAAENDDGIALDLSLDSLAVLSAGTFSNNVDLRHMLIQIANKAEEKLKDETDPEKLSRKREFIRLCRSPEQATSRLLKYMSWAFFILLPIFALVLKLFYIRRNQNYIRHLIFSIHIHSFIFLLFSIIVTLSLLFDHIEQLILFLLLSFVVYFIIALKKFYGQSIGKVILKFIGISFVYNAIFWVVLVFVSINVLIQF